MRSNRLPIVYFLNVFFFFILLTFAEGKVIQFDKDFNGKIDQWQHKSEKNELLKVEHDKNEDGQIDQVDIFDGHD